MLKILAIADTHVDDAIRLGGLKPVTEAGRPLVLEQAERTLQWITEVAARERVDLILHAGDVYERPRPTPASEAVVVNALIDWAEIAPTVVIAGNHDRPVGKGVTALEPLKQLAPGRLHIVEFACALQIGPFAVYSMPYPNKAAFARDAATAEEATGMLSKGLEAILMDFARQARESDALTVLLYHGTLRGASFSEYQVAPLSDVQMPTQGTWEAFDVQACGHLHLRQDAPGTGGLPGYIGSPDQQSFGEEDQAKGVSLFTIDDDDMVTCELVPNPHQRQFVTITPARALDPNVMLPAIADPPPGMVARVKGTVDAATFAAVSIIVREARKHGVLISNACDVKRDDRARVAIDSDDRAAMQSTAAVLDLVFRARPDLQAKEDAIRACVSELECLA